ncbi:MAG: DNA polymerase III subunit alpha [Fluviicola sp. XM-24bin1]|nr:MAG: DNA polymerase III subunit alpha [Fluviicola sp. XM-24bin1]
MYLNAHTYYSLRYGAMSPKELAEEAKKNGCFRFAVTDINTTSACLELLREAPALGIDPVLGVDFRNGVDQKFILLARNNEGFEAINAYLSQMLHEETPFPDEAPELKHTVTIYPFEKGEERELRRCEYVGVRSEDLPQIRINKLDTSRMVIMQPATFRHKKDFNAHRLLRAIDLNILLSKLPVTEQAKEEDVLWSREALHRRFSEFPDLIENTKSVLDACKISFSFTPDVIPQNQKYYTDSEENDLALLERLCDEGLFYRYPNITDEIYARIKKEMDTIKQMGFVSYFLMNWDIVNYARSKGYFYVGRGSGANSVVAYLLRITDVDPIELDLYFERFINLYRQNPPDFDIDFSWRDREDITRYIFERFNNVALVATYNTFKDRAVIRELGKVFGLPKEEIDKLSKGDVQPWELNHLSSLVVKYSKYIHGFPSHLSVHASGIIISEKPIAAFSATFLPPKGYPTIQFDMHIAEDVGLYKFDILSQRGLSKIKDTLDIIQSNDPHIEIDIHNMTMLKKDPKVRKMLIEAKPIGCFYVESPAMRMLLTKLRVDDYLGLVAASSVIRPGVSKSGMMQAYIQRFRNPEKRKEAHPVLLELMPETYGVMVYQEDVIKVAHHFVGLDLGEADKMRRGMSGKYRSREEFQAVKRKFFENCRAKGYDDQLTRDVWMQTESFAGYAFAKGHSASYAVESYQCLYLKAYYPLEFMVATINNYGGFYRTELYVYEARLFGATIKPPCINTSNLYTKLKGTDIYLGFHLLHSFDTKTATMIMRDREINGPYEDLDDILERIPISMEQIVILIRVNALRFTGKDKRTLLWEAHVKWNKESQKDILMADLFRVKPKEFEIPALQNSWQEDAFDQMELLGFSIYSPFNLILEEEKKRMEELRASRASAPDSQSDKPRAEALEAHTPTSTAAEPPYVLAKDLPKFDGKEVWIMGHYIHAKRTTTSGGEHMFFGTFLDEEGNWLDTVHFPEVAQKYRFRGGGVYKVKGKVTIEYEALIVEASYMEKMPIIEDPRYAEVRTDKNETTWNKRRDYGKRTNRKDE